MIEQMQSITSETSERFRTVLSQINPRLGSAFQEFIEQAITNYRVSAPAVVAYLDDLYVRVQDQSDAVTLYELRQASFLYVDGGWAHPNLAQNRIYKL